MYIYIYIYICIYQCRLAPARAALASGFPVPCDYCCCCYCCYYYYYCYEQALVCLSNREIVDASRGRIFHCKMANNRVFFLIVLA